MTHRTKSKVSGKGRVYFITSGGNILFGDPVCSRYRISENSETINHEVEIVDDGLRRSFDIFETNAFASADEAIAGQINRAYAEHAIPPVAFTPTCDGVISGTPHHSLGSRVYYLLDNKCVFSFITSVIIIRDHVNEETRIAYALKSKGQQFINEEDVYISVEQAMDAWSQQQLDKLGGRNVRH